MNPFVVEHVVCPQCHVDLDVACDTCTQCGSPTRVDRDQSDKSSSDNGDVESRPTLTDRPAFMLAFLFLASLFLGLPYLWRGRAFRTPAKVIITILVLIETVFVFWGFGLVMSWAWSRIKNG